eukprot:m.134014 g.134014  ORF g.134014 m.134014 type:complete len:65 (+) comp29713_c0_seq1:1781-1975(+)
MTRMSRIIPINTSTMLANTKPVLECRAPDPTTSVFGENFLEEKDVLSLTGVCTTVRPDAISIQG